MKVNFPGFSVDGEHIRASNGKLSPATPEVQALAAIYQTLTEINEKLNAPIVNFTNHPPETDKKK